MACLFVCGAGVIQGASAQQARDSTASRADWRLGVFVGVAHNSPVSSILGTTPGRDHLLVGLSATTTLIRASVLRVSYSFQLLPLVLIRGNASPAGLYYPGNRVPGGNVVYAFGVSPFGLQLELPLSRTLALYGASAPGGLVFDREYPVPGAGRISFTLEFGGGLFVALPHDHWLQAGYKYHHL